MGEVILYSFVGLTVLFCGTMTWLGFTYEKRSPK